MLTQLEHIASAKERALKELEYGAPATGPARALASVQSDLGKHPETAGHPAVELGMMLAMNGHLGTPTRMREFIEGIR